MKKRILALILVFAMLFSVPLASSAAGSYGNGPSDIQIYLNGKNIKDIAPSQYTAPVLVNGRTMVPARAIFESLGSNVDYFVDQTVVAKKDTTTLTFKIGSKQLIIDKEGQKSTVTMDTPVYLSGGRAMVPVRYLSEALDLNVSWTGKNVVLTDFKSLIDSTAQKAPLLGLLLDMPVTNPDSISYQCSGNISMTVTPKQAATESSDTSAASPKTENIQIPYTVDVSSLKDKCSMHIDFDIVSDSLSELIAQEGADAALDENAFRDLQIDAIYSNNCIYFKTNIPSKLTPESEQSAETALYNSWFKLDINEFVKTLNSPELSKFVSVLQASMSNDGSLTSREKLLKTLNVIPCTEDTYAAASSIADVYAQMYSEKYFSIFNKIADNTFSYKLNIDEESYSKLLEQMMPISQQIASIAGSAMGVTPEQTAIDDETLPKVSVEMTGTYTNGISTQVNAKINELIDNEYAKIVYVMTMNVKASKINSTPDFEIPENAIDLLSIIKAVAG